MKRLANERKYVEDMIKSKTLNVNRPGKDINSLIKYLYEQNPKITKQELIELVNKFLLEIVQDEKAVKRWQVSIREYVDTFMSYANNFKGLSHVEKVCITKSELENIRRLKNKKLEYVAFALLVYLKVQNEITGRYDNTFCPSSEEHVKMIKKITGLNITITKVALGMKELQNLGYTENGIGGAVSSKLNYVDINSDNVIEIRDFSAEHLHLYYEAWREEERLTHCNICGEVVIYTSKCPPSYCKSCKEQVLLDTHKRYDDKKRKS